MPVTHYTDETLTDARHALLAAFEYATLARFSEEGQYSNIQMLLSKLEDAAADLGFDLVKRAKPVSEAEGRAGCVELFPAVHRPCDTEG
jgi:hypothetical protein